MWEKREMGNSNMLIKSEAQFSIEIAGESAIEAERLAAVLKETVNVIKEINVNDHDKYVKLKITKFETGSFDIFFQTIVEQVKTLISNPEAATSTVLSVLNMFSIVRHLKGKKPRDIEVKGDNNTIVNFEGEELTLNRKDTIDFFGNVKIENSVINVINTVAENKEHTGIDIKGANKTVSYKREEMKEVGPVVKELLEAEEEIFENIVDLNLIIRKPDLIGNSKWGFVFDKNIEATIKDEVFLEKVRNGGITFSGEMIIPVKLKIETVLDSNRNPKPDPSYTVLEVTGEVTIKERDDQIKID